MYVSTNTTTAGVQVASVPAVRHRQVEMQPSSFVPRKNEEEDVVGSGVQKWQNPSALRSSYSHLVGRAKAAVGSQLSCRYCIRRNNNKVS